MTPAPTVYRVMSEAPVSDENGYSTAAVDNRGRRKVSSDAKRDRKSEKKVSSVQHVHAQYQSASASRTLYQILAEGVRLAAFSQATIERCMGSLWSQMGKLHQLAYRLKGDKDVLKEL